MVTAFSLHTFFLLFLVYFFIFVFMKPIEHNSVGSAHTGAENTKSSFYSCFQMHLEREIFKAFYKY